MKKFFSFFAAILFAGSMMAADATLAAGTNASEAAVNGFAGIKAGTSKATGEITVTVGANAASLTLYAAAWNNTTPTMTVAAPEGVTITPASVALTANSGISNNPPFTLSEGTDIETFKCEFTISGATEGATFTLTADKRFVVWGATYETGEGGGEQPVDPEPEMNYYVIGSMSNWTVNEIYKLEPNPAKPEGEEFMGMFFFSEGAEFKVALSDGETAESENYRPQGIDNNFVVTAEGTYTVYFRPSGDMEGVEGWHYGYIYIEEYVEPVLEAISLTQFLTDKPAEAVLLKDLTVIYATNKNTYVIDEDGVALVMYDANKTYYDGTLAAGTVLSGQMATYTAYKNQDEIIPTNTAEAAQGELAVPVLMEDMPTVEANLNQYLRYDTVPVTEENGKYYLGTVQLYGASNDLKPDEAGVYNVEGIFINYNGNTPELIVTGLEKIEGEKEAITLDFSEGIVFVDNSYYEEYGSTDLVLTNMELNEEYEFEGDGDYLDISLYLEDPNNIGGTYTDENEGLDLEYTFLDRVTGTDTVEIGFVMGEVIIEVIAVDEEQGLAQLSIDATLIGEDDNAYTVEGTFLAFYDFYEEEPVEAVENTEAAAKVIKRIEMGNVVIYKNGVKYSVNGQIVK